MTTDRAAAAARVPVRARPRCAVARAWSRIAAAVLVLGAVVMPAAPAATGLARPEPAATRARPAGAASPPAAIQQPPRAPGQGPPRAPAPGRPPRDRPGTPAAADLKSIDARLARLRAESAALSGEQRTVLGRLRQLEVARETRALERSRTGARLAAVGKEVAAAGARVAAADRALAALTPEVKARVVRLFKLLPIGYDRLLLTLDDARAFDRAARAVAVMARRDREQIEEYRRLRAARRADVDRLARERASLQGLQAQLAREEESLVEAVAEQAVLLRRVREQRELNEALVAELSTARDRLDRSVRSLPAAAARGAASPGLAAIAPGALPWPVAGRIAERFGRQVASRFGTTIVRNGVEIQAAADAPVRAVQAARVAYADLFTGFGRVVILDHGAKAYTLYGHLATITVTPGAEVQGGQVVGTVGAAPSGGPSLYFELRIDGRPVDPVQWLTR